MFIKTFNSDQAMPKSRARTPEKRKKDRKTVLKSKTKFASVERSISYADTIDDAINEIADSFKFLGKFATNELARKRMHEDIERYEKKISESDEYDLDEDDSDGCEHPDGHFIEMSSLLASPANDGGNYMYVKWEMTGHSDL